MGKRTKMVKHSNARVVLSSVTSDINFDELTKEDGLIYKSIGFNHCPKPLEKHAATRLQRAVGFDAMAEETSKWQELITERKKRSQLVFPLHKPLERLWFKKERDETPMNTELEKKMYSLLAGTELIKIRKNEKVTAEKRAIKDAMTLAKVKKRSCELWKRAQRYRILKAQFGDQLHLRNKTKSKKARGLMKKEKLRGKKSEFRRLLDEDPQSALEMLDKLDLKRVQERMTQRHKASRWVYTQSSRAANDEEARGALKSNEQLRREILEKLKDVKEAQQELMDQAELQKVEVNESIKNQLLNDIKLLDEATKQEKVNNKEIMRTPKRLIFRDKVMSDKRNEQVEENKEDLIDGLFADEMEMEFKEQKRAIEQEDAKPDKMGGKRPGWDRWTGPGIVEPIQKKGRFDNKSKLNQKKGTRSNVIYHNERSNKCFPKQVRVTRLPYPFSNVEDYENYISKPIGRQFVPETCHLELIAPPIVTKAGTVIEPMAEDALIKHGNDQQGLKLKKRETFERKRWVKFKTKTFKEKLILRNLKRMKPKELKKKELEEQKKKETG